MVVLDVEVVAAEVETFRVVVVWVLGFSVVDVVVVVVVVVVAADVTATGLNVVMGTSLEVASDSVVVAAFVESDVAFPPSTSGRTSSSMLLPSSASMSS